MWVTGIDPLIGTSWQKCLRQFILICFSLVNFCLEKLQLSVIHLATVVDDWLVDVGIQFCVVGWEASSNRSNFGDFGEEFFFEFAFTFSSLNF